MTRRRNTKRLLLCALLCAALSLSGCMTSLTERSLSESPPAPITIPYQAPQEDAIAPRTVSAVLYFLNYDETQLLSEVRDVVVEAGESLEQTVLEALFSGPRSASLRPLMQDLSLAPQESPVEVCGSVATVNLGAQARLLSPQELYKVRMSITATLCELAGIEYVNVLVEGREEGHDLAALMPMGTLSRSGTADLSAQWAQLETQRAADGAQQITRQATLYFPIASGLYVAPEVRTLTLASADLQDYVLGLLLELGYGAVTLGDARAVPAPNEYVSSLPEISLMDGTADKVIRLSFTNALMQALGEAGVPESLYWAMLVNTLTTFVPGIDGVVIRVDGRTVEGVIEQQTPHGQQIAFPDGVMRRADFSEYIAGYCTLYFPSLTGERLVRVQRAVRQWKNVLPRTLVQELLKGPDEDESQIVGQVFPQEIGEEDFIAFAVEGDALLINVTEHFQSACTELTRVQERNLVYAIVNAMTEISPIERVYFFVEGEQVSTLSGTLEMMGAFVRNPGIVQSFD